MTRQEQQEKFFRAIGYVGDDLIQRADAPVERKTVNTTWVKWAALAACCVLVIGLASRLPLLGAKTANTAPETASMMLDSTTATTEAKSEAPQMTEETAAEEAPGLFLDICFLCPESTFPDMASEFIDLPTITFSG